MLKHDEAVLVIVDIQGKLASLMHKKEEFYANVVRMINGANVLNIPIIWNEQLPDKLGPTIPDIKDALPGKTPFVKATFSCWGNQDFIKEIESTGRKKVLLTGMETHICVYQTAIDLIDAGYEVYLVADAVSSRLPHNIDIGINAMKDHGAKITSVEMILFEMLQIAQGDQFKQIIQIVK